MTEKSDGSTAIYYVLPPQATQLQHLISYRNMNAQIGEIFRACYRYGLVSHSDMLRDAKKMKYYAEAEIARLEKLLKPVELQDQMTIQEVQDVLNPGYIPSRVPGIKILCCEHMMPLDMTCYRCNPELK